SSLLLFFSVVSPWRGRWRSRARPRREAARSPRILSFFLRVLCGAFPLSAVRPPPPPSLPPSRRERPRAGREISPGARVTTRTRHTCPCAIPSVLRASLTRERSAVVVARFLRSPRRPRAASCRLADGPRVGSDRTCGAGRVELYRIPKSCREGGRDDACFRDEADRRGGFPR